MGKDDTTVVDLQLANFTFGSLNTCTQGTRNLII